MEAQQLSNARIVFDDERRAAGRVGHSVLSTEGRKKQESGISALPEHLRRIDHDRSQQIVQHLVEHGSTTIKTSATRRREPPFRD
jgi:hypothetical protein